MSTWIARLDAAGDGPRLAVKDNLDVAGVVTTAGSRAVADCGVAATSDAAVVALARAAGARIVGKANLTELARRATGVNPWFGTPVNPAGSGLLPGGSSSGSAAAVGSGEADIALGTDTAGSIRIPSACCGTTGLKTTYARVPTAGLSPLAPSLDVIGPMARDVAGVLAGMRLLEPGFTPAGAPATTVGRLRLRDVDPAVEDAVDRALLAAGFEVVEVELPGWHEALGASLQVLLAEGWLLHRDLVGLPGVDPVVSDQIALGEHVGTDDAWAVAARWRAELAAVFDRVQLVALPTIPVRPPTLAQERVEPVLVQHAAPVNLAGLPALALPVPGNGFLGSLQLTGPLGSEELLMTTGAVVEDAATV